MYFYPSKNIFKVLFTPLEKLQKIINYLDKNAIYKDWRVVVIILYFNFSNGVKLTVPHKTVKVIGQDTQVNSINSIIFLIFCQVHPVKYFSLQNIGQS